MNLRVRSDSETLTQRGHQLMVAGQFLRILWRQPLAAVAFAFILIMVVVAFVGPAVFPVDPFGQSLDDSLQRPSWDIVRDVHRALGTDQFGRGMLDRVIVGARVSITIGFLATSVSMIVGVPLGLVAGYYEGRLGDFIMRITDIQHSFPLLVLAIAVVSVVGSSQGTLIVTLGIFGWTYFARIVRGDTLSAKERGYVEAARSIGASNIRIMWRHIMPNVLSPVIVIWTFTFAIMIVTESGLSFLGLGINPPTPSLGGMVADGRTYLGTAWWVSTLPGLALMLIALSMNTLGDALRDFFDPRLRL